MLLMKVPGNYLFACMKILLVAWDFWTKFSLVIAHAILGILLELSDDTNTTSEKPEQTALFHATSLLDVGKRYSSLNGSTRRIIV